MKDYVVIASKYVINYCSQCIRVEPRKSINTSSNCPKHITSQHTYYIFIDGDIATTVICKNYFNKPSCPTNDNTYTVSSFNILNMIKCSIFSRISCFSVPSILQHTRILEYFFIHFLHYVGVDILWNTFITDSSTTQMLCLFILIFNHGTYIKTIYNNYIDCSCLRNNRHI